MDNQQANQQNNDQISSSDEQQNNSSIKERALKELIPVVDSLDSDPEKKYEILMTAARAASSGELLEKALNAATQIQDAAAKAEALVDVLNEASFQENNS